MNKDPKREAGMKKAPLHLLPTAVLRALAFVLALGAKKYGEWNWRESDGVRVSTYKGAILRHLFSVCEGEWLDPESGQPHLAHVMACCAILIDAKEVGKLVHDERDGRVPLVWHPPCPLSEHYNCANADSPVRCGSCVERPEGWTNFKFRDEGPRG